MRSTTTVSPVQWSFQGMTKSKEQLRLNCLTPGKVYLLGEPKPLEEIEQLTLAGCDLLELKYQDALQALDAQFWREFWALWDEEKDDEGQKES